MTPSAHLHRRRRRGGVYVLVLVNAAILSVIGLSALAVTRIQRRTAQMSGSAAQARLLAETGIDAALYVMDVDPVWQDYNYNDTWSSERALGDGIFRFKLVDSDGDLRNAFGDVRVYGRGEIDGTVRIVSVELALDEGVVNVIENSTFESGLTPWGGSSCDVEVSTTDPHSGNQHLWVKNRAFSWSAAGQFITEEMLRGETYDVDLWVKMKDFPENVQVTLHVASTFGVSSTTFSATAGTAWTNVTGQLTPSWADDLVSIALEIKTTLSTQEFMLDDVTISGLGMQPSVPVPGTWRREMN